MKCRVILFLPPKAVQDIYPAIKWFSNHFIKKQYYQSSVLSEYTAAKFFLYMEESGDPDTYTYAGYGQCCDYHGFFFSE